jgi:enoyl-CoA hydratase
MSFVTVERKEGTATLTITRPEALNALNGEVLSELEAAIDELEQDQRLMTLVVTGAGRAFVAGADIAEILAITTGAEAQGFSARGQRVFQRIADNRLITLMAVNGYALGGGLELALAGDLRFLAQSARVGLPEIGLGIIPGFGGTQRLARLIGEGRALWLVLSGQHVDAAEAERLGIANQVLPDAELLPYVEDVARRLATQAPRALSAAKRAVRGGLDRELSTGLALEADLFRAVAMTADAREGTLAFLEKRRPKFTGR